LRDILQKPISSDTTGETWEISTVPESVSIVANGVYKDKSLLDLIDEFPNEILGNKVYKRFGNEFPLLFKFIDARDDLSIQVHPNDELAKKRHNSFGKTEMWYIVQADENSRLIVGFKHDSSSKEYLENLKNKTLVDILDEIPVTTGDVFFLETGTVHAIGAGILLAEIQQTSDITYRIYDFDRVDKDGKPRELHVDEALEAINYEESDAQKLYTKNQNQSNVMVDCPYFTTNFLPLDGKSNITKNGDSFTVYMCVDGEFEIESDTKRYSYKKGDTILIPAALSQFALHGKASILEIYIS
jgi:mannose-6-phosphate isomerase